MRKLLLTVSALAVCAAAFATPQDFDRKIHTKIWTAKWAGDPAYYTPEYRVLHFRRSFDLPKKPESFKINVSADQRFVLYVNGRRVARGPARGDLDRWYFDTLDIAPHLKSGKNVIAALVWHAGKNAPKAQISERLSFVFDGATDAENFVATPSKWKMKKSAAFSPTRNRWYTGPGDNIDASKYDWGWTEPDFDDSSWRNAQYVGAAYTCASAWGEAGRALTPREIPQMEEKPVRMKSVRRFSGVEAVPNFIAGEKFEIPANTKCRVLLDNGVLTNAYPVLKTSKGAGAVVKVNYAEGMFDKSGIKGNRDEIEGRDFNASEEVFDIFRPDGGASREFSPLWFRTYRYVGLDIETKGEPLVIEDMYGIFTGYPFEENGKFDSDDASLAKIWEVGWRTARLCALETYVDCPYYEQLQYAGDTRIQALISLYVSGDDRLMRQAITAFDNSRTHLNITQSRFPSSLTQFIPPFSLYWIEMICDYAMFRGDFDFLSDKLIGVRSVLAWYTKQLDGGLLKPRLPFWNFVDWSEKTKGANSEGWWHGVPPEGENEGSAITTLQLAIAMRDASVLMRKMGYPNDADEFYARYKEIAKAVREKCWDAERGIFVDYAGAKSTSQHVNILAILADVLDESEQPALMKKVLESGEMTPCTIYFKFYLMEALRKVGMGDLYLPQLREWRDMLGAGLTTFAETPEPSRSDCHAWSSSPNYHLLSLVCGVMPADYGFSKIRVSPNLGDLKEISGTIPHPKGEIRVMFRKNLEGGIDGSIKTPVGGEFEWRGAKTKLRAGDNEIRVK